MWTNCSYELNTLGQIAVTDGKETRILGDLSCIEGHPDSEEIWSLAHNLATVVCEALNAPEAKR
jgi:hypothetical protein